MRKMISTITSCETNDTPTSKHTPSQKRTFITPWWTSPNGCPHAINRASVSGFNHFAITFQPKEAPNPVKWILRRNFHHTKQHLTLYKRNWGRDAHCRREQQTHPTIFLARETPHSTRPKKREASRQKSNPFQTTLEHVMHNILRPSLEHV